MPGIMFASRQQDEQESASLTVPMLMLLTRHGTRHPPGWPQASSGRPGGLCVSFLWDRESDHQAKSDLQRALEPMAWNSGTSFHRIC